MADPVSLEDIYIRAARRLKVIEINEPLSAEDRQVLIDYYDGVWAMLEGRGLVVWGESDPVPQVHANPVRDLLAEQAAHDFGVEFSAPWAIPELTRQIKPIYTYDETYFHDF